MYSNVTVRFRSVRFVFQYHGSVRFGSVRLVSFFLRFGADRMSRSDRRLTLTHDLTAVADGKKWSARYICTMLPSRVVSLGAVRAMPTAGGGGGGGGGVKFLGAKKKGILHRLKSYRACVEESVGARFFFFLRVHVR